MHLAVYLQYYANQINNSQNSVHLVRDPELEIYYAFQIICWHYIWYFKSPANAWKCSLCTFLLFSTTRALRVCVFIGSSIFLDQMYIVYI
jgi:hypothetical protein